MKSFYAQPKDSLDVIFVGSSRVFCDINPAVLWEQNGIASFDLATSAQAMRASVNVVEDIFKRQHPKVVVLEVSMFDKVDGKINETQMVKLLHYVSPSFSKYKTIIDMTDNNSRQDYLFDYSLVHGQYESVSKDDVIALTFNEYPETKEVGYKGYEPRRFTTRFDSYKGPIINNEEIETVMFDDLTKINKICKKNNAQLLLIYSPDIHLYDYTFFYEFAEKEGIKYLNANSIIDELGISPTEDFSDEGHLNMIGAQKWTSYLSNVLSNEYGVESSKGKNSIIDKSFEENINYLNAYDTADRLIKSDGLGTYFDNYPNPNYVMIVSLFGDYNSDFYGQEDVLRLRCGITSENYLQGGTWVFYNMNQEYYSESNEMLDFHMEINNRNIDICGTKDFPKIIVDGKNYSVTRNSQPYQINSGIQIVTYDPILNIVIDAIAFDGENQFMLVRNLDANLERRMMVN